MLPNKIIRVFIILNYLFINTASSQQNKVFSMTNEIEKSVDLNIEAIFILDSIASIVWPDWNTHQNLSYFIGDHNNNAVFINTTFEIPLDFVQIENPDSRINIYFREYSRLPRTYTGGGTIIKLDNKYYKVICMSPFGIDSTHYYLKRLNGHYENNSQNEKIKKLINSPEYYISVITHEAFHFYQENKENRQQWESIVPRYYRKTKVMAFSFIEGKLLQKANYCNDKNELKNTVRQFIAIREEKSMLLNKKQQLNEKVEEFKEGLAQYIQTQIQLILSKQKYEPVITDISTTCNLNFTNANDFLILDSLCLVSSTSDLKDPGTKHYFYGQAQARILDKLTKDTWKSEIMEKDVFLIDLLVKYSGYKTKNKNEYLNKTFQEYDFTEIQKQIRKMKLLRKHYIIDS